MVAADNDVSQPFRRTFFGLTELLKQYLKEDFAKEGVFPNGPDSLIAEAPGYWYPQLEMRVHQFATSGAKEIGRE